MRCGQVIDEDVYTDVTTCDDDGFGSDIEDPIENELVYLPINLEDVVSADQAIDLGLDDATNEVTAAESSSSGASGGGTSSTKRAAGNDKDKPTKKHKGASRSRKDAAKG